ncbi:MAG: hypothetical protein HWD62_06255 [Cyclobacteriaceae bacterium]|nr:MAG: hypothetical protein HWD62_06255 [Cyclobacteriaceae bacterium]
MSLRLKFWMLGASLFVFNSVCSFAQLNQARIAQNRLQAGKWESAYRLLKNLYGRILPILKAR